MALTFRLTSTGTGQARIDIHGVEISAKEKALEATFQRASDELYIGGEGSWQSEQRWHRLERIPDPTTATFRVGPGVVDPLAKVSHRDSFLVAARWADGQGQGVLRITGELIGSGGLKTDETPKHRDRPTGSGSGSGNGMRPIPGPTPVVIKDAAAVVALWNRAPLRWVLAIVGSLILATAAWVLSPGSKSSGPEPVIASQPDSMDSPQPDSGPSDPGQGPHAGSDTGGAGTQPEDQRKGLADTARAVIPPGDKAAPAANSQDDIQLVDEDTQPGKPHETPSEPPVPAHPESEPSIPSTASTRRPEKGPSDNSAAAPTPYDAPQLRGPEYVSWLIDQKADAQTMKSQAERRATQGDCPAVILLYDRAARSSPEVAAKVARLYDPAGFKPSPCIDQPSASNASEYYELAAGRPVPDVQQGLNEIQIDEDGPRPPPRTRTWENRQ